MKEPVEKISVVPSKRIFLSIIADYDLNRSICELIDNALDNCTKFGIIDKLIIEIKFNLEQQTITVNDNAGGIPKANLRFIVGPGQTGNAPTDKVIGIFGVGTKRAVVALAQDIKIRTRYNTDTTYMVEFDDSWLEDDDWEIQVYKVDDIKECSTEVFLQRLRNTIEQSKIDYLKRHLSRTYAKFLSKKIKIIVDNEEIKPFEFDNNWAYPPNYCPRKINGKVVIFDKEVKEVKVCITAGLITESSPALGEYGVYFYCNNRLIASALKNFQVGFATGLAGLPHPSVSLVRVIVSLEGEAILMPWNSSKSAISYDHQVFKALQKNIIDIVKFYASLSRSLEGSWSSEVFKYTTGNIISLNDFKFPSSRRLNFPPVPKSKLRYEDELKQSNREIMNDKPWTKGLVSGIVAADLIGNKKFDEKNRISLIILDSTLEIAFKEFLVNDSGTIYSDAQLVTLFKNRKDVVNEIKRYIVLSNKIWKKIKYYYDLRCKLIHERASAGINDSQIQDYTNIVQIVLKKMFKLNFKIA